MEYAELQKIVAGLVRIGTVTDINKEKRLARVKFQSEDYTSGWLQVVQHYAAEMYIKPDAEHTHEIKDTYTGGGSAEKYEAHNHLPGSHLTYRMPKINDTVLCLYLPVFNADGFILGGL